MLSLPLAALEGPEDRAAFLRFYDAHAQGLLRYARSLLREPALAEEAVQEAWLRCIRSAAAFLALPESYREVERIDLGALVSVLYDGPGGTLELSCQLLRAGGTERLDDSRHDAVDVTVGGWPGRLFVPRDGGTAMLLWCDETHSFLLLGPLPGEDLLSLAEGVTETTETTE